jgi:hypothetical protein
MPNDIYITAYIIIADIIQKGSNCMKTLNFNNLSNFVLVDQIHTGFVEVNNSNRLTELLEQKSEITLQPINLIKADFSKDMVVKCLETGDTFLAA